MNQVRHLEKSPLFAGLHEEHLREFFTNFSKETFIRENDILCEQGEIGDTMYLLVSGKLDILIPNKLDENEDNCIAVIESGAVIGELCVFGQKKRSATIRAAEDSILIEISGIEFRQYLAEEKIWALKISLNIAKILSLRLLQANEFIYKLYQKSTFKEAEDTQSELETYRQRFFDESLFN